VPKFHHLALEMWAEVGQNHKNIEFLRAGLPADKTRCLRGQKWSTWALPWPYIWWP